MASATSRANELALNGNAFIRGDSRGRHEDEKKPKKDSQSRNPLTENEHGILSAGGRPRPNSRAATGSPTGFLAAKRFAKGLHGSKCRGVVEERAESFYIELREERAPLRCLVTLPPQNMNLNP